MPFLRMTPAPGDEHSGLPSSSYQFATHRLASFVRCHAVRVVEVNHCDRRKRRNNGKSDTIDAEMAARSVLAGIATAVPKSADGAAEMVRQIKIARDTAVKARSSAIIHCPPGQTPSG